jgi:hypothetical protein
VIHLVRFQQLGPVGAGIDLVAALVGGPRSKRAVSSSRRCAHHDPTSETFEGDDKRAVCMAGV